MCRLPRAHRHEITQLRIQRPTTPMLSAALKIRDQLLKALDNEYNVIDMPAVVEVIGILERSPVTKEVLETTRLGKYINELRRRTSDEAVARRAKDLVRKWRDLIREPASADAGPGPPAGAAASSGSNGVRQPIHPALVRTAGQLSPGLSATRKTSQPASPSSLSPDSRPLSSPAISPRLQPTVPSPEEPQQKRIRGRPPLPRPTVSPPTVPTAPQVPSRGRGRPPKNKLRQTVPEPVIEEIVVDDMRLNGDYVEVPVKRGRKRKEKRDPEEEDIVKNKMASVVRHSKVKTTRELLQSIQKESSLDSLRNRTLSSLGVEGVEPGTTTATTTVVTGSLEERLRKDAMIKAVQRVESPVVHSPHEHVNKFLRTTNQLESSRKWTVGSSRTTKVEVVDLEDDLPPSPTSSEIIDVERIEPSSPPSQPPPPPAPPAPPPPPETVEEILRRLPPIDHDSIRWFSSSSSSSCSGSDVSDTETESKQQRKSAITVDRLHLEPIEGINGNWNDGCAVPNRLHGLKIALDDLTTDEEVKREEEEEMNFREWQECLSKQSFRGELLHVLPYVIID